MSPFAETAIIFRRELRKNFRSAKGIALAVLTMLGGAGMALLLAKINAATGRAADEGTPIHVLSAMYGPEKAQWLSKAPFALLVLLNVTVGLSPLLIALMGFDSVAPDIQHRTVRYWTLRSRRVSYFVAKWAGLWTTVAALTFVMDLVIWIVTIANGEASVSTTLSWGFRFWGISFPLCAVWSALAVLVSALFRTPMVALLVTLATFFSLWVASGIFGYLKVEPLVYLYPNSLEQIMLDPRGYRFAGGILASLAMALVYVAGGTAILYRRDV